MDFTDATQKVKKVLTERFDLGIRAEEIPDDETIFDSGLGLDSMAAIELVVGVEEEFGIGIDEEDMTAANFDTVDALVRLVGRKVDSSR